MGTYKARSNNLDEEQEVPKTEKEKKQESTEKAVDVAGEVALDYFTGGQGSKIKNVAEQVPVVGSAVKNTWDGAVKNVSKVVSKTPLGDVLKKADDAGITDVAKSAKDIVSMKGAPSGAGANSGAATGVSGNLNKTPNSNNVDAGKNNLNNLFGNNKKTASSNSTSTDNDLMGDLFAKLPPALKIKIIVIGGSVFLMFLMCVAVFANDDVKNLSLTNNTSIASSGGETRNCTPEEVENKLIYVGDSRAVGMQSAVENENVSYIADVGKGYDWLNSTGLASLDSKLQEKTDGVVILTLGVNDLYNIDNYIETYKSLIAKYPNIKFYVLSVNPVDESKTVNNGYTVTNNEIEGFNKKLSDNFPNNYLDSYSSLSNIGSSDGLHYDNDTYKSINNYITSNLSNSGKVICGSSSDVAGKLEEVGNWYIQNVNTYQNRTSGRGSGSRKYYNTPFGTRPFGDDCTEFTSAYMSYVSGVDIPETYSGEMIYPNGTWAQTVANYGWKAYSSDEIGSLQTGDILVAHSGILYSTKGHHAEIYINESETFGWGSIKSTYPTKNTITTTNSGGHVHFNDSSHDYITVYRYEGANTNDEGQTSSGIAANLDVVKMYDSSFNHGTKSKSNQKYIMLHDTEMSQDAATVVNSWKNSKSGVAAHFVVNRDGSIIQAVDLDTITHHAGWGGPGDFDSKFGVGNNDGKGNGDDLVGTTKNGYASYSSYGMNSYSIGIEMCHVNGENYPIAQLEAVDKIIAYIDSYYGFKSTIIDHKEWRPSNSDTDSKFSTYLNNYKNLRHH